MSILDNPAERARIDPGGMGSLLMAFPDQLRAAASSIVSLTLPAGCRPSQVVVAGLGGSAIGGDVIRAVLSDSLRVPMIISRDYRLPAFVSSETLVLACSYSGNTEETLSAYEDATLRRAAIICITTGGKLAARASADGIPVIPIPPGLPPRAALGYSAIAQLKALAAIGLATDVSEPLAETAALVGSLAQRYGPDVVERHNTAKEIARSLHKRLVAVYSSSGILEAAAVRWRGQIEENAKNLAFHHVLPEMNHNELVGWRHPQSVLQNLGVVFLRDRADHPQVQRRFELTKEIVGPKAGGVREVWSEGTSPLARIFSILYLGDFVSLYLAWLNGEDPIPVEVIDLLKKRLGS